MTEEEWLNALTPTQMLFHVENISPRPSARKLRFIACACCRSVWSDSWPTSTRNAVVAAEEFADGLISAKHLNEARSRACQAAQNVGARLHRARRHSAHAHLEHARLTFAANTASGDIHFGEYAQYASMYHAQVDCLSADKTVVNALPGHLRDVLGNPFSPVTLDPNWRSETVVALATGIYTDRAFDRMPILADALEEAGCDNADILNHCRGPGPHVRGCWVVDLVLGKQ